MKKDEVAEKLYVLSQYFYAQHSLKFTLDDDRPFDTWMSDFAKFVRDHCHKSNWELYCRKERQLTTRNKRLAKMAEQSVHREHEQIPWIRTPHTIPIHSAPSNEVEDQIHQLLSEWENYKFDTDEGDEYEKV